VQYLTVSPSTELENVVAVDVGQDHTCALTSDGGVHCAGRNDTGQCGLALGADLSVATTPPHLP
jgi:alpha-tubulin suppressor-like RCC1 family protein